ncbi:MAG TPA: enoyl-CoA hydratase-related protein [Candidatus Limnocylindria bacterium]|nr:enoyl-CoA hydratase-related protein [Candidatus Limnocylindria bacterium]
MRDVYDRAVTARLEHDAGGIARLTIARPEMRNAFDGALIARLVELARAVEPTARAVVLQSEGPVFCSGADVNWMRAVATESREVNVEDAQALAGLFATLDGLPMPLIVKVQGPAIGGGVGLVAVGDIVIASTDAWFQFAEVRVGIVPSVVSPYVIRRVGSAFATAAFVTAERIDTTRAHAAGLVDRVARPDELEETVDRTLAEIRKGSPAAIRAAKRLVRQVSGHTPQDARELTIRTIADIRATPEAQEGLRAFLERRAPKW